MISLKRVKRIFLFFYTISIINGVKTPVPNKSRYKILKGGRGSAKSWEVVMELVYRATDHYECILCCREIQRSMKQSCHKLIKKMIYKMGFEDQWIITDKVIRHKTNGSEFFFEGLWNNIDSIKSIEGVTICWIEEAQSMSKRSWTTLVPTIRGEEGVQTEIWATYNPTHEDDPIHVLAMNPTDNCKVLEQNFSDNPFFPESLKEEEQAMKKTDVDLWRHVYGGETMRHSDAEVLKGKWVIEDFETPENTHFYHGADFGGVDPCTLARCFIEDNILYIDKCSFWYHADMEKLTKDYEREIPTSKTHKIYGDSANQTELRYIRNRGFKCVSAQKTTIETGIRYLRTFDKIVIHSSLTKLIYEAKNWKYKIDPRTEEPTDDLVSGNDHGWDAVRYALITLTRRGFVNR